MLKSGGVSPNSSISSIKSCSILVDFSRTEAGFPLGHSPPDLLAGLGSTVSLASLYTHHPANTGLPYSKDETLRGQFALLRN